MLRSTPDKKMESPIRRYPRVGSQYQTKILNKPTETPTRPAPVKLSSANFPYESEHSNARLVSSFASVTKNQDSYPRITDSKTCRGGLLVHKSTNEKSDISSLVQPLIISLDNPVKPCIANEAWIQHMIHLHSTESTGKRNRAPRGGVKRKRSGNDELVWSLENILEDLKYKRKNNNCGAMRGEEEAVVLEHLKQCYGGNEEAAKLNVLVDFTRGKATKNRSREIKRRMKCKSKLPSNHTSDSWRDMYELLTYPHSSSILGQLQDDAAPCYTNRNSSPMLNDPLDVHSNLNVALEPDDLKGAWRSILACGKSIERQLNGNVGRERKPLLPTLLIFVGKAHALPPPETCFGTHHVMIEEVSNNLISILKHVEKAQQVHAKVRDLLFYGSKDGIDSDHLLSFLDNECKDLPCRLEEIDTLYKFHRITDRWESRLTAMLPEKEDYGNPDQNSLATAENLRAEAKGHGYISKNLIQLNSRINKAHDLKDRILIWKRSGAEGRLGTIKTVAAFVKEAKRIKLFSPEVIEAIECFRIAEEWIDRANIAIRSKISLHEIKTLIKRGQKIPVDLSEYMDKLETRVRIANGWLESLRKIIPYEYDACEEIKIWHNLQLSLQNGNHSCLHELSSEGNRIPVDLVAVKLLQLALDAKNWTVKAQKWIPQKNDSRKGKLCDLREQVEKLSLLRSKLPLPDVERERWKPAGEIELNSIIADADFWLAKYKIYLEGDNRRNDERSCISISKLRIIVLEGNAIHANIGNTMTKISRILMQAENWYRSYQDLLIRCGLSSNSDIVIARSKAVTTIPEMSEAVSIAKSSISLDLDEAVKLQNLLQRSIDWRERVALIAPKRSKRHGRGNRSKFTIQDLIDLIEESSDLPIDIEEDVNRLRNQLSAVESWRTKATKQLEEIVLGFHHFKSHINLVYGEAKDYNIDRISDRNDDDHAVVSNEPISSTNSYPKMSIQSIPNKNTKKPNQNLNTSEIESSLDSEEGTSINGGSCNSALEVVRLVKELNNEAKDISVVTSEGETGELLDNVSNWFVKSFKYLNSPRDIFDKRFFGAFDRFIIEGERLCDASREGSDVNNNPCNELTMQLRQAYKSAISEQLMRLRLLKAERIKFEEWCVLANQILSDEKKLTAEKLDNLAKKSRHFPANRDMVSKIRGLSVKVSKWVNETRELFKSGEKIAMHDAKLRIEAGDKLKVNTEELRKLKTEIRIARNWSNRAKKCNLEQGSIHVSDVKKLIEEHGMLLINMPDELDVLKQATVGYCICRRPYDGFMIGCDHCEEWYHGPCIGITESKAGRFEKFTCIRCATKKTYHDSANIALGIIRKWTCGKDLKKARQIENQKLQRKERKERKDVDKFTRNVKDIEEKISELECREKLNQTNNDNSDFEGIVPANIIFRRDSIDNTKLTNPIDQSDDPSANMVSVENGETANNTINDGGPPTCSINSSLENFKDDTNNVNPSDYCLHTIKDEPTSIIFSSTQAKPENETKSSADSMMNKDALLTKLEKSKSILQQSKIRLDKILIQSQETSRIERLEDKYSTALRHWCFQIKLQILVPSRAVQAEAARPQFGVTLTPLMIQIINETKKLGISDLPDVKKMIDLFKSLCWCLSGLSIIRRKPSLPQMQYLVVQASKFKLPDEKALRTMKFMVNRACQWQSKIRKALAPKKDETKAICVSLLKELQHALEELPLIIPERHALGIAIEDGGTRHCICGGPSDGSFMLCCDNCNKWFHGACIQMPNPSSDSQEKWCCPVCSGNGACNIQPVKRGTTDADNAVNLSQNPVPLTVQESQTVSPHAPDPLKLWPPFGLEPECSDTSVHQSQLHNESQFQSHSVLPIFQNNLTQNNFVTRTIKGDTKTCNIGNEHAKYK